MKTRGGMMRALALLKGNLVLFILPLCVRLFIFYGLREQGQRNDKYFRKNVSPVFYFLRTYRAWKANKIKWNVISTRTQIFEENAEQILWRASHCFGSHASFCQNVIFSLSTLYIPKIVRIQYITGINIRIDWINFFLFRNSTTSNSFTWELVIV